MTLILPGVDIKQSTKDLSQWFTTPELAAKVAGWSSDVAPVGSRILEPSVGNGALLEPLHVPSRDLLVTAFDIDPDCCARVRARFPDVDVRCEDFLHVDRDPSFHFNATIMNPPYEDGNDGLFVERAMSVSDAVVAVVRTVALNGDDRYKRVWSRVERGEWVLVGLRFLVNRPKFIAGEHVGERSKDGAKADFVVVKLRRRRVFDGFACDVGWW